MKDAMRHASHFILLTPLAPLAESPLTFRHLFKNIPERKSS